MNKTSLLLTEVIYPALYNQLDDAFPEFGFRRVKDGWQSTTERKIDGDDGKKGKVYSYERSVGYLKDYRQSGGLTYWDYVKERDGLSQQQVLLKLAEIAGVVLENTLTPEELANVESANTRSKMWEIINDYCIDCLSDKDSTIAHSSGAKDLQKYLIETRKYNPVYFRLPGSGQDRQVPKMELGYMPSLRELESHLFSQGYPKTELALILSDERIGKSHTLSIPYRDANGRMRGMIFRTIHNIDPKYLYSTGLEKQDILFNLRAIRGDRDLVVVEGQLDAYHASAVGIDNVVALGGNSLTDEQIKTAIKAGAKRLTFLLDNDKAGQDGLQRALVRFKNYPEIKLFIGMFPDGVKDIDQLIIEKGSEEAKSVVANAEKLEDYQLRQLLIKYHQIGQKNSDGALTVKQESDFFEEIVFIADTIASPIDRSIFVKTVSATTYAVEVGVTEVALTAAVDRLRSRQEQADREREVKGLLEKAGQLHQKGSVDQALEVLTEGTTDIRAKSKKTSFEVLCIPPTEEAIAQRQRTKPENLETSFRIDDGKIKVELPAGALTILAAPTSHGKTALLNNFGLDLSCLHPKKKFHFFSYEEDSDAVLMKALNAFVDQTLCAGHNNLKAIEHYFRTSQVTYIKEEHRSHFLTKKDQFFRELISTGRYNIHYVDYDADTLGEACEYLAKDPETGSILVDYAQLLHLPTNKYKTYSRQEELKTICLNLKDVAVATGLPIVLGAQFNRQVTHHLKMHSTMIGEAGDIERAANLIIGLWNNAYEPFGISEAELEEVEGKGMNKSDTIFAKVLKFRGGKPNVWDNWAFDGNTGKIHGQSVPTFAF
ncbi:DnaB-like helicase C-terminal domain-containing protein [Spirosoma arcticum]